MARWRPPCLPPSMCQPPNASRHSAAHPPTPPTLLEVLLSGGAPHARLLLHAVVHQLGRLLCALHTRRCGGGAGRGMGAGQGFRAGFQGSAASRACISWSGASGRLQPVGGWKAGGARAAPTLAAFLAMSPTSLAASVTSPSAAWRICSSQGGGERSQLATFASGEGLREATPRQLIRSLVLCREKGATHRLLGRLIRLMCHLQHRHQRSSRSPRLGSLG